MDLKEVGRRLSTKSETKVKAAIAALQRLLDDTEEDNESRRLAGLVLSEALSFREQEEKVLNQAKVSFPDFWVYVADINAEAAILSVTDRNTEETRLYRVSYAIVDDTVTLGQPTEVERVVNYVAKESALEICGDMVALEERAVQANGATRVKIIKPGWGSSGYYSSEMLRRDGPKVFTAGTKMYWDHPTAEEDAQRPERSLRDLAATLVSNAKYEETGSAGPGLYADAEVFGPYRETVNELAPHIGVSIRALGKASPGEAEGKTGPIIDELTAAKSVDFVTEPGAGGAIVGLFESARAHNSQGVTQGVDMTEQEKERLESELKEARAEIARLREMLALVEAKGVASEVLAAVDLPDVTRVRLLESVVKGVTLTEAGALDVDTFKARVQEAAKVEMEYIAALGASKVTGLGESKAQEQDYRGALESAFKGMGLSESIAKIAANGR